MNGNFARSILCSLVTRVDSAGTRQSLAPAASVEIGPAASLRARAKRMNAAEATTKIVETRRMVRREFIVAPWISVSGYLRTGKRTSDVESSAGISGNASAQAVLLILLERPGSIGWNSRDEMMVEATSMTGKGAQTLPRVPPPVSNQPIGTTAAWHNVFSCGRLFRLGLAVQLVSGPWPTVSYADSWFFKLFRTRFPSACSGERRPLGFGFHFRAAKAEDLVCILNRLSVDVILVCGENVEDMPKLVEEDQDLSVHRIACVRPHVLSRAGRDLVTGPPLPNLNYVGHWGEKGPFCVDGNCRVASVALKKPCDIRIIGRWSRCPGLWIPG